MITRILMLVAFLAVLSTPARVLARIERFAVIAGNNLGAGGDVPLHFAESDAMRVHDVLKDLGGFSPANMVLLRGDNADIARRTLIAMNDRIRQVMTAPDVQVLFFVYYSGHADATTLHMGSSALSVSELEQLVRGSAAAFRVMVLDACRSGVLTRVKGGTIAPPIAVRIDARLPGEGVVFLTASAANEDAQESDGLQGSFFTHYLVSGLLGAADTDGDGAVELEEVYRHAYENTLRATSKTLAGTQHPTFRYELRGHGKILLTSLPSASSGASGRGILELPSGRSYLVLSGGPSGVVVAEVSELDIARRLSVKAGNYFVRGRDRDALLEGTVSVGAGETVTAADNALKRVAYARLVRKGESFAVPSHGIEAGYRVRTAFWEGAFPCHGVFAGYGVETTHIGVTSRMGYCRTGYENDTLNATTDQFDLDVKLAHTWDLPIVSVGLGITSGVSILHTSFHTRGVAPPRVSAAGHVGVALTLSLDLPHGFYLLGEADAESWFFRKADAQGKNAAITPAFALRPLVGLGKRF